MKTKIKITIGDNTYEFESTYESGLTAVTEMIEKIVKQEMLLQELKRK